MHQYRDVGINYIKARKDHRCYGMGLGIIILDDVYPGFPGDVRNASAFPFPIQYEIAEGVDIQALVWEDDKSPCLEPAVLAWLDYDPCLRNNMQVFLYVYLQENDLTEFHETLLFSFSSMNPLKRRTRCILLRMNHTGK